eukprot:8629332-Pyramimonas_sp.AAC.1
MRGATHHQRALSGSLFTLVKSKRTPWAAKLAGQPRGRRNSPANQGRPWGRQVETLSTAQPTPTPNQDPHSRPGYPG